MLYDDVKDLMEINQAITIQELHDKMTKKFGGSMDSKTIKNNLYGALHTLQKKQIITKLGRGLYIRDY